jgi:hypothetical protein
MVSRGHRLTEVVALTGLRSRQQVQRLIQIGTAGQRTPAAEAVNEVQEASRQFEERLAAVEATLDEVVSGLPVPNEATERTVEFDDEDYDTVMAKEPYVVEKLPAGVFPPVVPGATPFDPLTGDIDELDGMLEPTQVLPALAAANQPTMVLPADGSWRHRISDPDAT